MTQGLDPFSVEFNRLARAYPRLRDLRRKLNFVTTCSCVAWWGQGGRPGVREELRALGLSAADYETAYHFLRGALSPCNGRCVERRSNRAL